MADQQVVVRPNGVSSNGAGSFNYPWDPVPSGNTLNGVLSDNSDSTYARSDESLESGNEAWLYVNAASVIPTNAVVRRVRVRARARTNSSDSTGKNLSSSIEHPSVNNGSWDTIMSSGFSVLTSGAWQNFTGTWETNWYYSGYTITRAHLVDPGLTQKLKGSASTTYPLDAAELYLDVDYNTPPTGNITAPTGNITDSTPTVTWNYSDAEGDAQTHFQVVVESGDHTADAAPNLSTNVYNSGETASSSTSHTVSALPDYGTYTAWVQVRHADVSGQQMRSTWDSSSFVYNGPPTATIIAPTTVIDDSTPLVEWAYSDPEGNIQSNYRMAVEVGDTTANSAPGASPYYDSGEIASSATSHTVTTALAEGVHTAWVRVNDGYQYSVWDSQPFEYSTAPSGKALGSLGQIATSAGIGENIYVVPTGKSANVSTITVCNRGMEKASFSILSIPDGVAEQSAHVIYSNANLGSHCTVTITIGMTLDANDVLRGEADSDNLSFSAFGVEQ